MGLFDFLKPKDNRYNHILTEEERSTGSTATSLKYQVLRRKQELELQRLELEAERDRLRIQADIEDLKDRFMEEAEEEEPAQTDNTDSLLAVLLSKVLSGQNKPEYTTPNGLYQPPKTDYPVQSDLTDEQILSYWNGLDKKIKKMVLKASDEDIKAELQRRMPDISDNTINHAIQLIRKQKI